ncbi:MAG: amidohydrolase family protein, partial [Myxococcota bacterium]|nr:amidohydrolase family protein [Myxococcota bacterium]
ASGETDAVLNHVAEATGGVGKSEIDWMSQVNMVGPGQAFVHATDATTPQLARMAEDGTGIVWSPRSNLDLYAATTPADVAMRLGIPLALGPDWTWSGSMNPARELRCASEYLQARNSDLSDQALWELSTSEAARILGLDGVMGTLEAGQVADLSVFGWSELPYRTVIKSGPRKVRLVVVGGEALFGVPEMIETLASTPEWCETVSVCGSERSLCVQSASSGDDSQTYEDLRSILETALSSSSMPSGYEYAAELHDLWMCEDTRASCDPRDVTEDDADGDGTDDGEDVCASAWDPLQRDHDGDGVGDACDVCPLDPSSETCAHEPGDIDGDGIATDVDTCPWLAGEDQSDDDGDGLGNPCDQCPDTWSPASTGCANTVYALRDPTDPDHPEDGTEVYVSGVVVTGIREGYGFYVQDPSTDAYGGIYVYDSEGDDVTIGDQVDLEGTYTEYWDLSEIAYGAHTITGTTDVPEAIEIEDACEVGTDGSLGEVYESMLVIVTDLTVTSSNPDAVDGDTGETEDYGEFEVNEC